MTAKKNPPKPEGLNGLRSTRKRIGTIRFVVYFAHGANRPAAHAILFQTGGATLAEHLPHHGRCGQKRSLPDYGATGTIGGASYPCRFECDMLGVHISQRGVSPAPLGDLLFDHPYNRVIFFDAQRIKRMEFHNKYP